MKKQKLPMETFIWVNARNPDVQDQLKRFKLERNIPVGQALDVQALMLFELMFMDRYIMTSYQQEREYLYPFFLDITSPKVQPYYEQFLEKNKFRPSQPIPDKERDRFERIVAERMTSKYRYILQQEESRLCNTGKEHKSE